MRNVIPGLLGCLIGLSALTPPPVRGQGVASAAPWEAPCFPTAACGIPSAEGTTQALGSALPPAQPPSIRRVGVWPEAVSALAALVLASTLDNEIQRQIQQHRSASRDDLARAVRRGGQPEVYLPVALGTVVVGLIAGDGRILRAGGRISGGLLLTGATVSLFKRVAGRARPRFSADAHSFRPLSSQDSWPSGHTAIAFALATSVSDEVHSTPVTIALYGGAALTGWSRLNDNRHWATDVAAGALVGVVSAKLMNGHWRVFGLRAPAFLLEGNRAGLTMAF